MEIQTNRFLLRDFLASDAPAFLAYHADPRNSKFFGPDEATPEHTENLLKMFQHWATQQPRQNYQLAVVQRQKSHALIGCVGLRCAGLLPDEAEFGMELAPNYWGRHAYAVEIGGALLAFGFGELGVRVITGSTVSANAGISRWPSGLVPRLLPHAPDQTGWLHGIGAAWLGASPEKDGSIEQSHFQ